MYPMPKYLVVLFFRHCIFLLCLSGLLITQPLYATTLASTSVSPSVPFVLHLREAIFLALRNNPNIRSAELDRVVQKYSLYVARHEFMPNYSLTGSWQYQSSGDANMSMHSQHWQMNPSVSLKTHYGTQFTLSTNQLISDHPQDAFILQVTQPLIQGFGRAVVDAALQNAMDSELINQLSLKETITDLVHTIINNYIAVFTAQTTLTNDQNALKSYETMLENNKELVKAGRQAENKLISIKAQIASQKATFQNDSNHLYQIKLQLLDHLGLPSNIVFQLPEKIDFESIVRSLLGNFSTLTEKACIQLAMENNIAYQQTGIALKTIERSYLLAKDAKRWRLDLAAEKGFDSVTEHRHHETVGLNLTIPIDDVSAQQTYLSAKIGLEKAYINYKEQRKLLEISVINARNSVLSVQQQLELSKQALDLQKETVEMSTLEQHMGRISEFELLDQQKTLVESEKAVISNMISYIQALIDFQHYLGATLDQLNIPVKI
jgi:outer membrane protein TolC